MRPSATNAIPAMLLLALAACGKIAEVTDPYIDNSCGKFGAAYRAAQADLFAKQGGAAAPGVPIVTDMSEVIDIASQKWVRERKPHPHDEALTRLALAGFSSEGDKPLPPVRTWYSSETGHVMLCASEDVPSQSCGGYWWDFVSEGGAWRVEDSGAWACFR